MAKTERPTRVCPYCQRLNYADRDKCIQCGSTVPAMAPAMAMAGAAPAVMAGPTALARPVAPPAGWYADPQGRGQRYWSGSTWTEQFAPGTAFAPSTASAPAGDWVGGVLLSLLLPFIGLIAGVVYVAQGGPKRDVGIMCIALSCVAFVVFAAMLSGGG